MEANEDHNLEHTKVTPDDVVVIEAPQGKGGRSSLPIIGIFNKNSIMEDNAVLRQFNDAQGGCSEQTNYLLSRQTAEGPWLWEDELLSSLGLIPSFTAQSMEVQDTKSLSGTIAATALVLKYFDKQLKDDLELWTDKFAKGGAWLLGQVGPNRLVELLGQAEELIC
ncbi:hypothetical protein BX616_001616 [Lobosporangium transversale]|uniref:Uncharacterized protein n=1 Tax=Lobosporangium transversale TaxID=64571 RepID=A0A1Y2GYN3_9FUNG|nr:hypothetical protein BCR41DRAFT_411779 [Lobosporangium transversale]KAF9917234.1 hypothetical protein BX616_001616 [Lobosporangium transversale]ORZ27387.1 hypothetical protein BCR41DRAFT_411779 [Lobosporangium transversale]|eukprot:XP_021885114.1 hypothetical protein BCR41DRAFT_411779 [Lobosporangium transversale]